MVYLLVYGLRLVVDQVPGPVLAHGSTATGSLTSRVKPERLTRPSKIGMTTSTIIAKNGKACMSIPQYVCLLLE